MIDTQHNRLQILPVIHHLDRETSLAEVKVARECGVDGVFLISHRNKDHEVCEVAWEARMQTRLIAPEFRVGINLLHTATLTAFERAVMLRLDMVWDDDMGVNSDGLSHHGSMLMTEAMKHPEIECFASVAFKYQAVDPNPPEAARRALQAGFTPTTSGVGTGHAPEVEKIAGMSAAVGGKLAIASGMTPENVHLFAPHLSRILVSTGVSRDEYRLDPVKLKALIENARNSLNRT